MNNDKGFFYDRTTGEKISPETMEKARLGEIQLNNVGFANRSMLKQNPEPVIRELPKIEKGNEDLSREDLFFDMVNNNAIQRRPEHIKENPDEFQLNPTERLYEKARRNSIFKYTITTSPLPKRNRNNKKSISKSGLSLGLAVILAVGIYAGGRGVANKIEDSNVKRDTRQAIASYVSEDKNESIVKKHTIPTEDKKGFWYDNYAIAEDMINMVPDSLFDSTLFSVYLEMGHNVSNSYIDNFGRVISAAGRLASPEQNPIAYARTNGCSNFEEFAIKNGFLDENGMPSFEAYKKFGMTALKMSHDTLKSGLENFEIFYKANDEDSPSYGGRS